MKILYLHQHFKTPDQSGGTRSYEFARRWVRQGHEVAMITTWQDPEDTFDGWRVREIDGISVHELSVPYSNAMNFYGRLRAFLKFALRAGSRAARLGGDAVFATSTPLTIAIPGIFASRRLKVPMIFEVRDLWPELPIAVGALRNPVSIFAARKLERWAYRNARHVVALSSGMAAGVVRAGKPESAVSVVPNSCDLELFGAGDANAFFDRHPAWRGRRILLYAGTYGAINDVGYLVDLAAHLRELDPTMLVLLVGRGRERDTLEAHAKRLGVLGKNLEMLPPQPKSTMPDVLAAAGLAVSVFRNLPEMWNNSANKFFDGLAAGRPVGVNHEGWQADLIREESLGVVMPADDPAEGAAKVFEFLSDPERIAQSGRNAAQVARSRFDRDRLAQQVLELLTTEVRS